MSRASFFAVAMALAFAGRPAVARAFGELPSGGGGAPAGVAAAERPAALREVGFDQKLDEQVPLDLMFRDESGQNVRLRDVVGGRPALLQLSYYHCPMLCPLVLSGLVSSLKPLALTAGKDFDVVVVSIDPAETPAQALERKRDALGRYERPGSEAGWHFLTGSADSIARLTRAVGFRYAWDDQSRQFAHAAGVILLTADGHVSRYFFGAEFSPRDLRLGLVEASDNRIGSLVDQVLLFCFHYDPALGRYSAAALTGVRAAGVLTVLAIIGFIGWSLRREMRARPRAEGRPAR